MKKIFYFLVVLLFFSCGNKETLKPVTFKQFSDFVKATGYKTDAEKFGWTFKQKTVFDFDVIQNADFKTPNGIDTPKSNFPVTQVSYNDAIAYCKWSGERLPTYKEYWEFAKKDNRKINFKNFEILPIDSVNVVGNVWDICEIEQSSKRTEDKAVRLAGGSFLCSEDTCNGPDPKTEKFVDKTTGNTNIGFSIISKK